MSNRSKFVDLIATANKTTKKEADHMLTTFVDLLKTQLLTEGQAVLPGFGRILLKERAARKGHNPKTGAAIDIAAKVVVGFKAFPGLLEATEAPATTA